MKTKEEIEQKIIERMDGDKDIGNHLGILYFNLKNKKNLRILEFGTFKCSSTMVFLLTCIESGGKITTVDISKNSFVKELEIFKEFEFINIDSKEFKSDEKFDVIFIDSKHTYKQIKKECEIIEPLLKQDSIIFFHDTNHNIHKEEVKSAVNEFIKSHNCESYEYKIGNGLTKVILK